MSWTAEFFPPIALPDGGRLRTVGDARDLLNTLRGYETLALEWQTAIAAVLMVGEKGGATDIARAAVVEALIRSGEEFAVSSKEEQ